MGGKFGMYDAVKGTLYWLSTASSEWKRALSTWGSWASSVLSDFESDFEKFSLYHANPSSFQTCSTLITQTPTIHSTGASLLLQFGVFSEIPAKGSFLSLVSHINTKLFENSAACATSAGWTGETVQNWRIMPFPRPKWRHIVMVWAMILGFRLQYEKIAKNTHSLMGRTPSPGIFCFAPAAKKHRLFLI